MFFTYLEENCAPEELLQTVQRAARAYLSESLRDSQDQLRFRFMNQRYTQWYGQPVEAMLGRTVHETAGDAIYYSVESYLKLALSGSRVSFPTTLPYPDGITRDVTCNYVPDEDGEGTVRGIFVLVSDETEQRRAETALYDSEAKFRAIFEQSVIGIALLDERGRMTDSNRALQRILGRPTQGLHGLEPIKLVHRSDLVTAAKLSREMAQDHRERFQTESPFNTCGRIGGLD